MVNGESGVRDYFDLEEAICREMMPLYDDVREITRRDRMTDAMGWGTRRRYTSPVTRALINRNPEWIGVP